MEIVVGIVIAVMRMRLQLICNNNVATLTQPQHDSESQHLESCVIHACSEHTETETEEQGTE